MKRTNFVVAAAMVFAASACNSCSDPVQRVGGDTDITDTGITDMCVGATCDGNDDADSDDATMMDAGSDASDCPAARTCASQCCEEGQLCLGDACVTPGIDCDVNQDCPDGEVCEPILGKCIPDPGVECTFQPDFEEFDPEVELAWRAEATTPAPEYDQVMMTPAVADITEDGTPDVVFSSFTGGAYNEESVLRAFDGRTFQPIFDLTDAAKRVSGSASVALGDIDNDLKNEIVAVAPPGQGLIAFDDHTTDWEVMWTSVAFPMSWSGAYLTDLDGDGTVEIVAGRRVLDAETGEVHCANPDIVDVALNSSAADLDDDGILEVVTGAGAFRFVDNGDGTFSCPTYWTMPGGFPAVADFGNFEGGARMYGQADGIPEVVTVSTAATEQIQLLNGQTGERIWAATLPTTDHPYFSDVECQNKTGAGPPTVADFDGDGEPEIAMAGACYYVVYETDGTLLWKHPSQDFSSRVTGSSVFDFEGDGKAEVVYADECFVRVYDGEGNGDGTTEVLFKRSHSSGTTRELPVIVDVDRDYHAEIIMISNDYSNVDDRCRMYWPDYDALGGAERGVLVVEDPRNEWVTTRPVWNQHAYHVTNVCDGLDDSLCPGAAQNLPGVIPPTQEANWKLGFLNNFRQNVQGEGLFDAPDLVVADIDHECGGDSITIAVTVANQGARGVVAGTKVALYFGFQGDEELVTVLETTVDLPPGGRETLTYDWTDAPDVDVEEFSIRAVVDSDDMGAGLHNECIEDNNTLEFEGTCQCMQDSDCDINEFCADGTCVEVPD
jgi:outer membrane protein assembly factor BamB